MLTAILPRQKLLVMNEGQESTQQCVVLSVRARQQRGFDIGFEFSAPAPQFWQNFEIGRGPLGRYLDTLGAVASSEAVQTQSVAKAAEGFPNTGAQATLPDGDAPARC